MFSQVKDEDICFCFVVYNEVQLSKKLISNLQNFYPNSDIICITDGISYLELEHFCNQKKVKYVVGNRLLSEEYGGLWLERHLLKYLEFSNAKFMIKVDPDTLLNRKFSYFPSEDLAGDLCFQKSLKFIQGGCRFHKRSACEILLNSSILQLPKYILDPVFKYKRFCSPYLMPDEQHDSQVFIAEDKIICDAADQLGLSMGQWNEVYSKVRAYCPEPHKYAVIHPVKKRN